MWVCLRRVSSPYRIINYHVCFPPYSNVDESWPKFQKVAKLQCNTSFRHVLWSQREQTCRDDPGSWSRCTRASHACSLSSSHLARSYLDIIVSIICLESLLLVHCKILYTVFYLLVILPISSICCCIDYSDQSISFELHL